LDFGWKLPATFFARPKVFKYLRFDFPQFSQSKSTIKIRNKNPQRISRIWTFKQAIFRAKKERNVLVEMGILGDYF
jgi:hypothetical protein